MKLNITGKNENGLLKRTELKFEVEDAAVPPSRKELREKIAALQNVKPDAVIVAKIEHGFGSKKVVGTANVYKETDDLKKTELAHMVGRNEGKKKGIEGQETAPQPAPEGKEKAEKKPAENKVEEKEGGQ